jgi:preprotein translocase subunit YajC
MHRLIALLSLPLIAFAEATGPGGAPTGAPDGGGGSAPQAAPGGGIGFLLMMLAIPVIFYFLAIRPQRKEEKKRKELIDATKPGDRVVTIGGAHGTVVRVGETTMDIRFGESDKDSVVIPFNKSAVSSNQSSDAKPAAKA